MYTLFVVLCQESDEIITLKAYPKNDQDIVIGVAVGSKIKDSKGEEYFYPKEYFTQQLPKLSVKLMRGFFLFETSFDDGSMEYVTSDEYREAYVKIPPKES